ncbi:sulfite exporter TauE/SafE family protein [Candidatus Curtissbacteria bacterium]|nr:sulfite exporter TauE/SafE family protein [Candidatus Curtissbacteria bacterium]
MPVFVAISFVSGVAAILTPCIWPLLPIVLSTSVSGSRTRPVGAVLGIITSFTIFTLLISFLISLFSFDVEILRKLAAVILLALGLALVVPAISLRLEAFLSILSSKLPIRAGTNTGGGFGGGYLTGLVLGLVWSPCAAPILAIVATISATQTVTFAQILVVLVFAVGLAIPLLLLALFGAYLFSRVRILSQFTGRVQQVFGVIIILTAAMIFFNLDRNLQAAILDAFPAYSNFLGNIEGLTR